MAADQITVTPTQRRVSLNGVITQLKASGIDRNHDSFAHAMDDLGMWDFVFNQAEVIASLHMFSMRDATIMRKMTAEDANKS